MRWFAIAGVTCIAVAFALGGAAPFGRVALAIGLYPMAAKLFSDPDWQGVALYRAGVFDKAASAFERAGNQYNLGNAYARTGQLAAALEAYDQAMARETWMLRRISMFWPPITQGSRSPQRR